MKRTKMLKKNSGLSAEEVTGKKVTKKKPKLYPIPPEDSFIPLQEDSEEVKYTNKKNKI